MAWIIFALLSVAIIIGMIFAREKFLRTVPIVALAVFSVIAFFAWYQSRELENAKHLIAAAEVEFADTRLDTPQRGPREWSGRMRNHSKDYTLDEVTVRLVAQDCVGSVCEAVDQADITLHTDVPPGQARDFRERVYFRSLLAPKGTLDIRHEIVETRGK